MLWGLKKQTKEQPTKLVLSVFYYSEICRDLQNEFSGGLLICVQPFVCRAAGEYDIIAGVSLQYFFY